MELFHEKKRGRKKKIKKSKKLLDKGSKAWYTKHVVPLKGKKVQGKKALDKEDRMWYNKNPLKERGVGL